MTTNEKNIALQCLKDAQQAIESLEEEWTKAAKVGQPTEELDKQFDKLLAKRRGIETLMIDLGIKFDRKDYRHTDLNGNTSVHTLFYLV